MIPRLVEPELLDSLPASDPAAIHSRRDLRIINRFMRNAAHLSRCITALDPRPRTILELGSGDGTLLLDIAARLPGPIDLFLLDMQPVVARETVDRYRACGWNVHLIQTRLEDWLQNPEPPSNDLTVANLFLHHFSWQDLQRLFATAAKTTETFVSCDPRRWRPALWCTRLLWVLGCNRVTLNDARISVQAGFRDEELSAHWPDGGGFRLREMPAGLSSHLFLATKCTLKDKKPA